MGPSSAMSSSLIGLAMEDEIPQPREVTRTFVVPCRNGIHLRVAGVIVYIARQFRSDISLTSGHWRRNAKSILGLLSLGAIRGRALVLMARGVDADRAIHVLSDLFESPEILCKEETAAVEVRNGHSRDRGATAA